MKCYLPPSFNLDDVAAFWCLNNLLENRDGKKVVVKFYELGEEEVVKGEEVYFINCGPNDYKLRGLGSAVEAFCQDFSYQPGVALSHLIDVLRKNNQTGYLRQHEFSFAFILRAWQVVAEDKLFVLEKSQEIIEVYMKIVGRKFNQEKAKAEIQNLPQLIDLLQEMQEFLDFYRKGRKLDFHIFTLPWYIACQVLLGEKENEIYQKGRFWLIIFEKVEKIRKEADEMIKGLPVYQLNGRRVCVAKTNNPFIAEAIFRADVNIAVVVVINFKGNIAILTEKKQRESLNLKGLYEKLSQKEAEHWFYDERTGAILNGSVRRPKPPTKIELREIIDMIFEQ